MDTLPLGTEVVTPMCIPELAAEIRSPRDLFAQTLIESDNKKVRWTDWFAANGLAQPKPRGPRFDRSFLSISAAVDGLGVALESTRLAEKELASGRLIQPLQDNCEDVTYTGHWLVYPRSKRYLRSLTLFSKWIAIELGLRLDVPPATTLPPASADSEERPGIESASIGTPPGTKFLKRHQRAKSDPRRSRFGD